MAKIDFEQLKSVGFSANSVANGVVRYDDSENDTAALVWSESGEVNLVHIWGWLNGYMATFRGRISDVEELITALQACGLHELASKLIELNAPFK